VRPGETSVIGWQQSHLRSPLRGCFCGGLAFPVASVCGCWVLAGGCVFCLLGCGLGGQDVSGACLAANAEGWSNIKAERKSKLGKVKAGWSKVGATQRSKPDRIPNQAKAEGGCRQSKSRDGQSQDRVKIEQAKSESKLGKVKAGWSKKAVVHKIGSADETHMRQAVRWIKGASSTDGQQSHSPLLLVVSWGGGLASLAVSGCGRWVWLGAVPLLSFLFLACWVGGLGCLWCLLGNRCGARKRSFCIGVVRAVSGGQGQMQSKDQNGSSDSPHGSWHVTHWRYN
jgi:hypothetical protein